MNSRFTVPIVLWAVFAGTEVLAEDCVQGEQLYEASRIAVDPGDRVDLLRRSLASCRDPVAYADLGTLLLESGDADGARQAFFDARDLSGEARQLAEIHALIARSYLAVDRLAEALAAIDTAFLFTPGDASALMIETRLSIDTHPRRTALSAGEIARTFAARRSMAQAKGLVVVETLDIFILFDTDRDLPNQQGRRQLAALGTALSRRKPGDRFEFIGHADARGLAHYNQGLSERRADRVARLIAADFPLLVGRIETRGLGETQPRYPGAGTEAYRLNRRIEVQVVSH